MGSNMLVYSTFTLVAAFLCVVAERPGSEGEIMIRKKILKNHDKTVRPAIGSEFPIHIGIKMRAIVDVDDKEGTITMKSWVVMEWNNTFIKWEKSEYKNVQRVHFLPTEIWFPDIALYNNGDPDVPIAGGTTKFRSNVVCKHNGACTWSGAAIFIAHCEIHIKKWPFDTQTCDLVFGSSSYDKKHLQLKLFRHSLFIPEGNSNWKVESLNAVVSETDHGHCCPYKFAKITYSLKIKRLFGYQMFYIFGPCCILTILSMLSFLIPSESGERIGFVTSQLLSLMVYLLVVPASLPVSSKEIPILGVIIMLTLIIISFVLFATILVLRCFFRTDIPPKWLRFLASKKFFPRKSIPVKRQAQDEKESFAVGLLLKGFDVMDVDGKVPKAMPLMPEPCIDESVSGQEMWQDIAVKLDVIFFWISVLASAISYAFFIGMAFTD